MHTTTTKELRDAYKWHRTSGVWQERRRPIPNAVEALQRARDDIATGKARYPRSSRYSAPGAPFAGYGTKAMRWCESPADIGLRFVGYADQLARIDHNGWYTDEFQSDTVRGVVYQLPARNGRAQFVAGYDNADNGAADNGGPAAIDFGTIWESAECQGWSTARDYDAARDAAYHADKLAERMAEREREYQAASSAGFAWACEKNEIAQSRALVRKLLAERRQAKAAAESYPTICETLAGAVRTALADMAASREKMARLAAGDGVGRDAMHSFWTGDADLRAAFNESAGETVLG